MFYLPLSFSFLLSSSSTILLFSSSIFLFPPLQFHNFNIFPPPPPSPPPNFYGFPSSTTAITFPLFSFHHRHHISIVFPPPPNQEQLLLSGLVEGKQWNCGGGGGKTIEMWWWWRRENNGNMVAVMVVFIGWRSIHGHLQYDTHRYQYVPWHPLMGEWWSFWTNFLQTASPLTRIIDGLLNYHSNSLGFWEVLCCRFSDVERLNYKKNTMDGSSCLDSLVYIRIIQVRYELRFPKYFDNMSA